MSPRLPASPHRLYTNGLLNGRSASVGVGFRHLQSVRLNIRQCTYWFSNTAEIGWKLGGSTSHHNSRVRATLGNRKCRTDKSDPVWQTARGGSVESIFDRSCGISHVQNRLIIQQSGVLLQIFKAASDTNRDSTRAGSSARKEKCQMNHKVQANTLKITVSWLS